VLEFLLLCARASECVGMCVCVFVCVCMRGFVYVRARLQISAVYTCEIHCVVRKKGDLWVCACVRGVESQGKRERKIGREKVRGKRETGKRVCVHLHPRESKSEGESESKRAHVCETECSRETETRTHTHRKKD